MKHPLVSMTVIALVGGPWACSQGDHTQTTGDAKSAIVNGTKVGNTSDTGVVSIKATTGEPCAADEAACLRWVRSGTGQLVAPNMILTANHVLDDVLDASLVEVRLGDEGASGTEARIGEVLFRHHDWNQKTRKGTDVALIRVNTPFTHGQVRVLSTDTTDQIVARPELLCRGYGERACPTGPNGSLYEVLLNPQFVIQSSGLITLTGSANSGGSHGDSGGPCIGTDGPGDIQGVMVQADCGISTDIQPPETFKFWYDRVFEAVWTVVADFNGNGLPDTGALIRRQNTFVISFIFDNDTWVEVPIPVPFPGFQDAQVYAGQFNADPFADVLLLVDHSAYYFDFDPTSLLSLRSNVTFGQYERLRAGDFDGDGFDDAVGVDAAGFEEIYYGSPSGLTARKQLGTMPPGEHNDGRFLLLSGTDEATLPVPQMSLLVISEEDEPELSVELFDGSFGSGHDRGTGATCYELRTDPFGDGAPGSGTLVKQASDEEFPDNAWKAVYRGVQHPDAHGFNGAPYVYRLDMTIGPCGGAPETVGGNALKVRSTSALASTRSELSFWARDGLGPWLAPGGFEAGYNTDYDGTFLWYVDVSNASEITLIDADADHTPDDDTLSPYRCDLLTADVRNDGREAIANGIYYELFEDQTGALLATNSNPSGNYWDFFGEYDQECRQFPLPPLPGVDTEDDARFIDWKWSHVLSGNQVHIQIPQGSPTYLRLLARPQLPPSLTSATSAEDWTSHPGEIRAHLPIVLGERDVCGRLRGDSRYVGTNHQALRILDSRSGWPFGRPTVAERTRAQLLALKLNLARASQIGDRVANAWVYGTEMTVSELVDAADKALSRRCVGPICRHWHGCGAHGLPSDERTTDEELNGILKNLKAVNGGRITYITPDFAELPSHTLRLAPRAISSLVEEQGTL